MRNDLIRAVLDCGVDDLSMLDDSGGIFRMSEAVKETRKRLEDEEDAGTLTEAGYEQLGAIRQHDLNPQSDFTYYVNCLDTHLHCDSSKKKVYEEMFEQEMQDLSDYTGFNIEG